MSSRPNRGRAGAVVVLAFLAFISLGLPDGLMGVAWPGIREHFSLPVDALGVFLIFATAGYMTSSFLSGALVRAFGVGGLLAASCAATATALAVYSVAPSWWVFVGFGTLGGLGAGAIDAGLNNYIDRHHNERLMQWLHASFGVGITIGPIIMTTSIQIGGRWQPGYQVVAAAQLTLALAFVLTRRKWQDAADRAASAADGERATDVPAELPVSAPGAHDAHPAPSEQSARAVDHAGEATIRQSLLHVPSLVSMLLYFTYTGAELGLGLWAYTFLTEGRGVPTTVAGIVTGSYWASFTIGRILAGVTSSRVNVQLLVGAGIAIAIGAITVVWIDLGTAATVAGIAVTGFVIAPIFPGMMSDTRNRVEPRHLSNTIGMQIAAAGLGAAAIPAIAGVTARTFGLEAIPAYLVIVLSILFVLFVGSHLRRPRAATEAP
ncbi:MAG: MFS transporter [bacterium]